VDAERARIDALFLDLFETDRRGAVVFDVLYRRFAAGAKVHTEGGIDAVLKTYQASAHREVIEYIVRRCNRARGTDDEPINDEGNP
jgi:hypothetical protein